MKFYFFSITNDEISKIDTSAIGSAAEYINAGEREDIFYMIKNGAITNIICEAENLTAASRAVNEFLSSRTV